MYHLYKVRSHKTGVGEPTWAAHRSSARRRTLQHVARCRVQDRQFSVQDSVHMNAATRESCMLIVTAYALVYSSLLLLCMLPDLCHACGGPGRGQARAHVVSRPALSLWHFTSLALLHSESIAGGLLQRRLENRCRWTTTITYACDVMFTHQMLS